MAQAPTPRFSSDQSQPVIIQNKMPKAGETDVTGQLGGGGGNNTFRLLGNTSTTPAATTTTSNPYPVGYTSGIPQGYDTVSGPGAAYNPSTGSGSNTGGGSTGGETGSTDPKGGMFINMANGGGSPRGTGTIPYTAPVNNPGTYNPNDIGRGIGWGQPGGWDPNTPSPGTTGGPQPGFGQPRNGGTGGGTGGGPVGDPGPKGGNVMTGGQQSQSYSTIGAGGMPVQYGAMDSSTNGGGKPSGNGSPYLGPPGGGSPMGNRQPATGPNGGVAQPNRDRFQGWHMGSGAWQSAPGRGPAAPTWMGGQYNPWTGQPGDPAMAGGMDNLRMMNSGTSTGPVVNPPIRPTSGGGGGGGFFTAGPGTTDAQTTGGFDPTANHPNYPGTGYGRNWTSGPYFQIPQGWNTAGPPGRSQQGGNYTPAGPDYTPPGKTEVGGNAVRVGVPRPNEQGAQRGWRYQQAGVPIYNDQLPPVGGNAAPAGSDMAAREPGYLGPPVHTGNYPPFPPFDPQNPPSPQQWLEIVRQWMAQYPREGNPNPWQGQAPSNPIQNPTWGAPWPGWQGGDLRNFPPSRPPGGTR